MDIDKKLMERLAFSSQEQREALQALLSGARVKPELALVLAVFRDVVVFRDLINARIIHQDSMIDHLETEIEALRAKLAEREA